VTELMLADSGECSEPRMTPLEKKAKTGAQKGSQSAIRVDGQSPPPRSCRNGKPARQAELNGPKSASRYRQLRAAEPAEKSGRCLFARGWGALDESSAADGGNAILGARASKWRKLKAQALRWSQPRVEEQHGAIARPRNATSLLAAVGIEEPGLNPHHPLPVTI
jgi:hypothetical protein